MGKYITEGERYQIEILLKQKYGIQQVADSLGHKYHTIYQEIKRGTVKQLDSLLAEHYVYKADYAQMIYERNTSNRGRNLKIGSDYKFVAYIEDMIKNKKYSPEALLFHARNEGLHFDTSICVKTIYNYLDMGLFLHVGCENLPVKKHPAKHAKKKSKVALHNRSGRSIEERPEDVMKRETFGHWEMDTVVSAQETGSSCLLVLTERKGREEILIKMESRSSACVVHALNSLERKYGSRRFREKFRTITCDNGSEFLNSGGIEKSCLTKGARTVLYYCHPYSSYERGSNENCNRLVRRFFPKGTNFDDVDSSQVAMVQDWINNYPRKILGGMSSRKYLESMGVAV